MGQRVVGRHVRDVRNNNKVGAWRYPVTLHDGVVLHYLVFEGGKAFGSLDVQCDFANGGQAVAQAPGVQDGDLLFDNARLDQSPDTAQAGGCRGVHLAGQILVGQAGVALQMFKNTPVKVVELRRRRWCPGGR